MKLDEIKIGAHYGAAEKGRRGGAMPRQVEAVKIEPVEEKQWDSMTGKYGKRTVRKVVVKMLDDPRGSGLWTPLLSAKKGDKVTLPARALVAPWKELAPGIQAQHRREQEARDLVAVLHKRLRALGFRESDGNFHVYASGDDPKRAHLSLYDTRHVEKMLALAEAGAKKKKR